MLFRKLIRESTQAISHLQQPHKLQWFRGGAHWMGERLHELASDKSKPTAAGINYTLYGIFKYGISGGVFLVSLILFYRVHPALMPLAVFVFYIAEVHFLFLFPLLLEGERHPVRSGVMLVYRSGFVTSVFTVMCIGIYMLTGLLRFSDPLRNWYTGCYAVLIWYRNVTENRP